MPQATHTDNEVSVTATTTELGEQNIVWSLEKDGQPTTFDEVTESELTNSGGTILFKQKGTYKVTATITDAADRVFTDSMEIKVYPVATFDFALPTTTHTDTAAEVTVTSSEIDTLKAVWNITKDGEAVEVQNTLTNEGGTITFDDKGIYRVKSTLTDELNRVYTCEKDITVYPVAETGFYMPTTTHTDTDVKVESNFKETDNLEALWTLQKDGKDIPLADGFYGTLLGDGGTIRFKDVGTYSLTATVTDETGRKFSYTASTTVYPVITVGVTVPTYSHTDKSMEVTATTTNAGTLPVEWIFTKNDVVTAIDHSLGNMGGTLQITEKGEYLITAQITDETGRIFKAQKETTIHPVPTMTFDIPIAAHTDDVIDIVVATTDMENLTAIWYVDNTHGFQDWDTYVDGSLQNQGGEIRFKRAGVYDLQARVTDETGRVFRFNSGDIEILPVLSLSFEFPQTGYTDTVIDVRTRGNNGVLPIEWTLMKNGTIIPLEQSIDGSLNAYGGEIRFTESGEYRLTATMFDALGRIFTASEQISIHPLYHCDFTMPSSVRTGQEFVIAMSDSTNLAGQTVVWTARKDGVTIPVTEYFNGTIENNGGTVNVTKSGSYALTATITDELGRVFTSTETIDVVNTAPTKPTISADVTRTAKDGKLLVNFTVASTDPDGDDVTYEYLNTTEDNYYSVGTHTIKVRTKDNYGGISAWTELTFTVSNLAPSRPTITHSPNTNLFYG